MVPSILSDAVSTGPSLVVPASKHTWSEMNYKDAFVGQSSTLPFSALTVQSKLIVRSHVQKESTQLEQTLEALLAKVFLTNARTCW